MRAARGGPVRALTVIDGLGWGGAEMLLADFAEGAPAAGIELSVAYLREKDGSPAARRLRELGVDPVLVPIDGLLSPSSFRSVRRHIAAVAPDVVHTHLGYADLLAGVAARSLRVPWVSSVHVMTWEDGLRDATKLALFARARRHGASTVITVSDAARRAYLAQGWDRPAHVQTVRNGVVGRARPGTGAAVRDELGLLPHHVVVAMVSVLRPGKGHDIAVEALLAVVRDHPEVRLLVVGDGPSRDDVAALLAPLGDAVILPGHRDDVMAVLDAVDVLIHPSAVDAFPTALLEAMAASVPVVATAVGGIPEIVDPDVTGLLLPAPPDAHDLVRALERLVGDAPKRRAMGAAGRARFDRELGARAWAARTRAVYERAISPGSPSAWRDRS